MFILLTVFFFIFISIIMAILHLVRPRFSIQGFLSVLAVLAGLVMVFLARSQIPNNIVLLQWGPQSLFPIAPSLMVDDISWYFTLALVSIAFTTVITSIAQLGRSLKSDQLPTRNSNHVIDDSQDGSSIPTEANAEVASVPINPSAQMPNWLFWIAVLILTSMGLLAVTSGNLLTLVLSWAALDIIELVISMSQLPQSENRERVIIVFTARLAGIVTVLMAGLLLSSRGGTLQLNAIPQSISLLLIIAAAIRLGVFPPQQLYSRRLPMRSDLTTVMRLISAAAGFILLVRVASVGITPYIIPYLLGFFALVGIFGAARWLVAKDELDGRSYWMLGTASMAIAAAILGSQLACLAWSLASLLSGGLIFSFTLRHRYLIPIFILGVFNLSTLPFSPTWQATALYQSISAALGNRAWLPLFSILLVLIQALLLSGFITQLLKGILPAGEEKSQHIERWVWVLYPIGLILIIVAHLLIGWFLLPELNGLPIAAWVIGALTLLTAALILFISWRLPRPILIASSITKSHSWNKLFSLEWLYNFIWMTYRTISRLFGLFSTILEGDGGIIWALVLFALIFVFLQR